MVQVLYKQVLKLEIWHDFFLGQQDLATPLPSWYDLSRTLTLVPTTDCLRVLKKLRWVMRPSGQGIVLLAQVNQVSSDASDPRYQTCIPVTHPERLTFWMQVSDRTFANFSNLPLESQRQTIFYFSNLANNAQASAGTSPYLFLSQPLSSYAANTAYALGTLVTQGTNTLEAIQHQASSEATPTAEAWESFPLSQYVSPTDRLPCHGFFYTLSLADVIPGTTVQIVLTNTNEQVTFSQETTIPDSHSVSEPFVIPLQFAGQKSGRYRLAVDGTTVDDVVLADPLESQSAFALVEIVLNPALLSPDFVLLEVTSSEESGVMKQNTLIQPKTYRIRFKNRGTRWRYRYERPHRLAPADLAAQGFELIDPQTYATLRPLGLRQHPSSPPLTNGRRNLPFPKAALIKPVMDGDRHITDVFSDVHL